MDWQDSFTKQWEYGYAQAKAYYEQHGDIDVDYAYVNENGFPLGKWLKSHTALNEQSGRTSIKVTPERKAKLDKLGFKWDKGDPWNKHIAACIDTSVSMAILMFHNNMLPRMDFG